MISANNARIKADENNIANRLKEIEESINKAVSKGKYQINVVGVLPQEIIDELQNAGYTIQGSLIKW